MERVGRYLVVGQLGEGGMGVVLSGLDENLGRRVAIKRLRGQTALDLVARERLMREARAAASLSHPNICQIYEIGEDADGPFLVMELLDGEPLAARIERGPMTLIEAAPIALALLEALGELDRRGLVHRDLKPSNVFLTPTGPKLLDFGLVRAAAFDLPGGDSPTFESLTSTGLIVGTPRYMSPEQLRGEAVDVRSDQFAFGALFYEILSGTPAFAGEAGADVMQAILTEQPRALVGSEAIAAVNRIILRAVSKRREDRYPGPTSIASELRRALALSDAGAPVAAQARSRLAVLPLKIVPPDSGMAYLGPSLAEAIAAALSGLESLVVRYAPTEALDGDRVAGDDWRGDVRERAKQAEVDLLLAGTVLVSGKRIRVTAQLVDGMNAAILGSCTVAGDADDLFALEDALVQRVSDSLAIPFTERERKLARREVPRSAAAHEFFLRAQELRPKRDQWAVARELYQRAIDEDARYAPAWVGLARLEWQAGRESGDPERWTTAEAAAARALELAPDLAPAHELAAELDLARGRPLAALERLVSRLAERPLDAELFAALVTACRYLGLLDASLAADLECRRLDARHATSVHLTWALLGEWELAGELGAHDLGDVVAHGLAASGRREEALALIDRRERENPRGVARRRLTAVRARLEDDPEASRRALGALAGGALDPEERFLVAAGFAALGEAIDGARALAEHELALDSGYAQPAALGRSEWTGALAGSAELAPLVARAELRRVAARARFDELGGPRLLGLAIAID